MTKVPHRPPPDLARRTPVWSRWPARRPLWQFVNSAGGHAAAFGHLRGYGPLPSARFDPHPEPASDGSGELVAYAARTLLTAVAERFQHNREVRRDDAERPVAYAWRPTRGLRLIDLTGPGAVALGASHALSSYRKDVTRNWARAVRGAWPRADGLLYSSAMTGEDCVALWAPAADSYPGAPTFARALGDPAESWQSTLRNACAQLAFSYA